MRVRVAKDRADRVAGLLILTGDRLTRAADRYLAPWNMGESDYNALRILNGASKPLTQVEIGRKLLCSRANVTKILDRLEDRHMARRRASDDRRENLIEITALGVKFLRETIHEILELSRKSLSSLTIPQLMELEKLLLKIVQDNPGLESAIGERHSRNFPILTFFG
jgi:DNA-binding MarR family transcriptional regulator